MQFLMTLAEYIRFLCRDPSKQAIFYGSNTFAHLLFLVFILRKLYVVRVSTISNQNEENRIPACQWGGARQVRRTVQAGCVCGRTGGNSCPTQRNVPDTMLEVRVLYFYFGNAFERF